MFSQQHNPNLKYRIKKGKDFNLSPFDVVPPGHDSYRGEPGYYLYLKSNFSEISGNVTKFS